MGDVKGEMDDLVRLKTGFEIITDINQEIATLCAQRDYLACEYRSKIEDIEDRLRMLRHTKNQLTREMTAGKDGQ